MQASWSLQLSCYISAGHPTQVIHPNIGNLFYLQVDWVLKCYHFY